MILLPLRSWRTKPAGPIGDLRIPETQQNSSGLSPYSTRSLCHRRTPQDAWRPPVRGDGMDRVCISSLAEEPTRVNPVPSASVFIRCSSATRNAAVLSYSRCHRRKGIAHRVVATAPSCLLFDFPRREQPAAKCLPHGHLQLLGLDFPGYVNERSRRGS